MRALFMGLVMMVVSTVPAKAADEITISKVNLEGLMKAVAAHKGKIVVIDIWATFCPPCKEKFPHIVELHNKLKDQGVVFISLTIDEAADMNNALEFLKAKKATFQNFLLEDTEQNKAKWEDKFPHESPPLLHVFDRSGSLVKTYTGKKSVELDSFLDELLKKK